jgi:membrane-associated phospholipid phosphatase
VIRISVALCIVSTTAVANAEDTAPAYQLRAEIDIPVLAIAAATTGAWFLDLSPASCAPLCDTSGLDPLDKPFAGRYHPAWTTAGTFTAAGIIIAPPLLLLPFERARHVANDTVVIGESMLVTSAFEAILETAVRRPRPFLYSTAAPLSYRNETSASLSFPSGHTGLSFAATFATWRTLDLLHVAPRWKWLAFGVGLTGASFVGMSRVVAGDHFPTDVIAGAAIGTGFGVLIPALHRRHVRFVPTGTGLAATGAF